MNPRSKLRGPLALLALLLLAGLCVPGAAVAASRAPATSSAAGPAHQRVLVTLDPNVPQARTRILAEARDTGAGTVRSYDRLPVVAVDASSATVRDLRSTPGVLAVLPDEKYTASATPTNTQLVGATTSWAAGFTGVGQTVAILDTGVDKSHPMLTGKVLHEACFALMNTCPDGTAAEVGPGSAAPCTFDTQMCPHGTHVAGIAAGNSSTLKGVAPDAKIAAVQVFTRETFGCPGGAASCAVAYTSDVLAGLDYIADLNQTVPIAAVNLSLGGGRYGGTCDADQPALTSAITALLADGVVTVVSSGNDGFSDSMASPACISTALAVGSSSANDVVSSFSNSSSKLTLVAPGEGILSAWSGGTYRTASGTSMAAPHVSGAVALLRQASPTASGSAVVNALTSTCPTLVDGRNGLPVHRLQVDAALAQLGDMPTQIQAKYAAVGGAAGFLGAALGPEAGILTGCFDDYRNGTIHWSPATGAHEVHGAILSRWAALGGDRSQLGFPVSDEVATASGTGRMNQFQGGAIYWTPSTGAQEVYGAIFARWQGLGADQGVLHYPVTGELGTPDGVGRFNLFQGGAIYWTPFTNAHEVGGDIRARWGALGWERSALGYPVTDELPTLDGTGRYNDFQNGSIFWSPATGAQEVRGLIRATWVAMGAEHSPLGYPVTNEIGTPDGIGRFNHFQNGSIYWTPATGAQEVRGAIRARWASLGWERSALGYPVSGEYAVPGGRRSDFQHGQITWDSSTGATTVVLR